MGIYSSDKVYGLKWEINNIVNNEVDIIFEEKYETEISRENKLTIKIKYESIINQYEDISILKFYYYFECSASYDNDNRKFMMWMPTDKNSLDTYFSQ